MISITSPSLRPSSSISLSGRRAKPRPLSAGGRLATCTLREVTRSIVSVSGIFSPGPRPHTATVTAARRRGSIGASIFDRPRDFANHRAWCEAAAEGADLLDDPGNHNGLVLVEAIEAGLDDSGRFHRHPIEQAVAAKAGDLAEFGARRPGAEAGDMHAVLLQLLVQRLGQRQDEG